ncbi:MAG TPA: hypothetical protein VI338_01925 [Nitrososphaera sp.]|nr:hypothetical protein [Nitrososphaera sp.]
MTDFILMPIWLSLSWLIRQLENGIGNDEVDEFGDNETLSNSPIEDLGIGAAEVYDPIVQLIKIGIGAFSLLLLGLSISAYKKTALKGIIYAAVAFGLFAVQLFFDYLEDAIVGWEQPYNDVIFYAMTLGILVLFFLALIKRK